MFHERINLMIDDDDPNIHSIDPSTLIASSGHDTLGISGFLRVFEDLKAPEPDVARKPLRQRPITERNSRPGWRDHGRRTHPLLALPRLDPSPSDTDQCQSVLEPFLRNTARFFEEP